MSFEIPGDPYAINELLFDWTDQPENITSIDLVGIRRVEPRVEGQRVTVGGALTEYRVTVWEPVDLADVTTPEGLTDDERIIYRVIATYPDSPGMAQVMAVAAFLEIAPGDAASDLFSLVIAGHMTHADGKFKIVS